MALAEAIADIKKHWRKHRVKYEGAYHEKN